MESKILESSDPLLTAFMKQLSSNPRGHRPNPPILEKISVSQIKKLLKQDSSQVTATTPYGTNGVYESALMPIDQEKRFEIFIQGGANVNCQNKHPEDDFWNTPLHLIIAQENLAGLKLLLSVAEKNNANVDFNIQDRQGKTPLILACKLAFTDAINVLFERKKQGRNIDMSAADRLGNTALHYACAYGLTSVVLELITFGADVKALNKQGKTPIDMLSETKDCLKSFLDSVEVDSERDEAATSNNYIDKYNQPLTDGHQKISISMRKSSAQQLEKALKGKLVDAGMLMQKQQVALSAYDRNTLREQAKKLTGTSILTRCLANQITTFELLQSQNLLNAEQLFFYYVSRGDLTKVKELLMSNPSLVQATAYDKNTALHIACDRFNLPMIDLLLDFNAKCNLENSNKQKPHNLLQKTKGNFVEGEATSIIKRLVTNSIKETQNANPLSEENKTLKY